MKVIVTGAGRGGTNLLTELVRSISDLNFTKEVEDRGLFSKILPHKYATKLATENPNFTRTNIKKLITENNDIKFIFSIRHPIDNCLSKIYRGRPKSKGGDKVTETYSADGNIETSVDAINKMYDILNYIQENWSDKVHIVKMEDIILDTESQVESISDFLGITPKNYEGFQSNNRNPYQNKRYGNKLDQSQINRYKRLNESFNGFFDKQTVDILKNKLDIIISEYYG